MLGLPKMQQAAGLPRLNRNISSDFPVVGNVDGGVGGALSSEGPGCVVQAVFCSQGEACIPQTLTKHVHVAGDV